MFRKFGVLRVLGCRGSGLGSGISLLGFGA